MRLLTIIAVLTMMLLSGCIVVENTCDDPTQPTPVITPGDTYELFTDDALTLIDQKKITSDQVTVDGVSLGDDFNKIVQLLGPPNVIDEFYDDNVINAKYENEEGSTMYIFHLENDSVTRIVIRGGANTRLPEGSKVKMDLATITSRFGKPDYTEDVLLANSGYRTYYYYTRGLEIYHVRKDMIGYALIAPGPVPENLDYNNYE